MPCIIITHFQHGPDILYFVHFRGEYFTKFPDNHRGKVSTFLGSGEEFVGKTLILEDYNTDSGKQNKDQGQSLMKS